MRFTEMGTRRNANREHELELWTQARPPLKPEIVGVKRV